MARRKPAKRSIAKPRATYSVAVSRLHRAWEWRVLKGREELLRDVASDERTAVARAQHWIDQQGDHHE